MEFLPSFLIRQGKYLVRWGIFFVNCRLMLSSKIFVIVVKLKFYFYLIFKLDSLLGIILRKTKRLDSISQARDGTNTLGIEEDFHKWLYHDGRVRRKDEQRMYGHHAIADEVGPVERKACSPCLSTVTAQIVDTASSVWAMWLSKRQNHMVMRERLFARQVVTCHKWYIQKYNILDLELVLAI